jgi:CubicO group peptidase (beta-lactamase class C family)
MNLSISLLHLDGFIYAKDGDSSHFTTSNPIFEPGSLHFRIASITKTLMAAFYLAKIENSCRLHQALDAMLPHASFQGLTPYELLSMRSGLTDDWFEPEARYDLENFLGQLVFDDNKDF